MAISIQPQGGSTVSLFTTSFPSESTDGLTGRFFDISSFGLEPMPQWITNYAASRDGGYKHYVGSKDQRLPVILHLTGTSRFDDLKTWENIAGGTVFYLEMDADHDANLTGDYVVARIRSVTHPLEPRVELKMTWERYNN